MGSMCSAMDAMHRLFVVDGVLLDWIFFLLRLPIIYLFRSISSL